MSDRRGFIKKTGLFTAWTAMRFPVWGGDIGTQGYPLHNIPERKDIDPLWIKTLYERGAPTAYRKSKNELRYIGMPVGGLHAGTVYVGGDGRLWLWQIYNETFEGSDEGIDPKTILWNDGTSERKIGSRDGSAYVEPAMADNKRVLEQGFAIKVVVDGKTYTRELNEDHWDEVIFKPAYPVATVEYKSKDFPASVSLTIYSPFIPLDAENSALPATILRLTIHNGTGSPMHVSVLGWLENGVHKLSGKANTGKRVNTVSASAGAASVCSSFEAAADAVRSAGDSGTMCFTLHGAHATARAALDPWPVTDRHFDLPGLASASADAPDKLVAGICFAQDLAPGTSVTTNYSICWHFNHPHTKLHELVKDADAGFYYGARFTDAGEVSRYIDTHFEYLTTTTELWSATWNNSTLPHWFLERTFVNIGTLATANTYRFADGRFWSWEGVGACPGTCTHVWQYAQAMARIFPELERDLRQRVDLGVGFAEDSGAIFFRGEDETRPAIDGQAGTILRFYREHQMSRDRTFLETNWPKIRKAVRFMLDQDKNGDGMTDSPMENTLDAVWEGEIAWIVGLCIAAASAAQAMATEMNDQAFAGVCAAYVANGSKNMERDLFNGEYFIHRPDAVKGRRELGSYNTCHIDQIYGQSWAFQVGLPRIISREKATSALKALWKYNFTMDVGPYIKTHTGGRPYALPGEGGMVMNTNPHNEQKPYGENTTWQLGYFHECMSGFEHQVAAHFMAEGMVEESLILTRVIQERYHAAKRNPFNEIECSDHYARAMASYGTFITACGFAYHGPKGYIRFAPQWNQADFKAPFTSAAGWGTYTQRKAGRQQLHTLTIQYGELALRAIALETIAGGPVGSVTVTLGASGVPARLTRTGTALLVTFDNGITVQKDQTMHLVFTEK